MRSAAVPAATAGCLLLVACGPGAAAAQPARVTVGPGAAGSVLRAVR